MKKIILSLVMAVMLVTLVAMPVFAAGKNGPAGKSNVGHVYLYEKDSNWSVVEDGAWGRFNYEISGQGADTNVSGVFNGHGLVEETEYSLIYFPETREDVDWPWGVKVLGTGTANEYGNVHITGSAEIGFPDTHFNENDSDYFDRELGDKIWLVLSDDIVNDEISGWNPDEYLFEDDLINKALLLCEKDPSDWSMVYDGAWGAYVYELSRANKKTEVSGDFWGFGLPAGDYKLIYYPEVAPDPWDTGGYEVVVIGEGTVVVAGVLNITGSAVIGFPDEQPGVGDYVGETGDKIWLVPSSDVEDGVMNAWNPTEYLFEAKLINAGK